MTKLCLNLEKAVKLKFHIDCIYLVADWLIAKKFENQVFLDFGRVHPISEFTRQNGFQENTLFYTIFVSNIQLNHFFLDFLTYTLNDFGDNGTSVTTIDYGF